MEGQYGGGCNFIFQAKDLTQLPCYMLTFHTLKTCFYTLKSVIEGVVLIIDSGNFLLGKRSVW